MSLYFRVLAILTLSMSMLGQPAIAKTLMPKKSEVKNKKRKYANRRLLVRYKDNAAPTKIAEAHFSAGAYVIKSFDIPTNLDVVEVSKGISLDDAQEFYREDSNVLYVEPDVQFHAFMEPAPVDAPPTVPDPPSGNTEDPNLGEQWGLNNNGQSGGTVDVDINAPEMWEITTGDENIVIGVIDTGVNYLHPDLKDNIWVNPGEIPGNGLDDDNNGVIDDIHGFNAYDSSGDPMDDHGHGSHCAGIIAARGKNNVGGSGVMQKAKIIACKFLSANGSGSASGAIECLNYFRRLKARTELPLNLLATSNSWGGGEASQALLDAIQFHQDEGVLFLAAASNEGQDNDIVDTFPADYPLANIISVAATDHNDDKAWFSNYGKRTVHVGAPGDEIYSTVLGQDYEKMSGTSMATPFAAGLVGMIKAANPSLNYMQVKNLLMAGGVPVASLAGKTISGRRIRAVDTNGLGSLTCVNQIVSGRLSPPVDRLLVPVGQTIMLSAININCAEPNGDMVVPFGRKGQSVKLNDNGIGIDSAANDGMYTKEWKAETPGRYEFLFPDNDLVTVSVYDPTLMKKYVATSEEAFNWRSIQGTSLNLTDDSVTTMDTPFPILFGGGGVGFDQIAIDSNGALSLTDTQAIGFNNQEFPINKMTSLLAPLWDDLRPGSGSSNIYYEVLGSAPNREFVVEWRDVHHYSSSEGVTFQVVFFESSSDILFNYLDVTFGSLSLDNGASATVGIQTTPELSVLVGFDTAKLSDKTGLRFSLAP